MAKLFALEEADVILNDFDLEDSSEASEVSDIQADVTLDLNEMQEVAYGIEEGIDAASQLEDIHEVVENACENGGLNPVAAEAVRIAIEAICARVGANPKSVYALYATENFTSASSRRANTYYALEGIGEFLKNIWEKIKTALISLWKKIKDFWNKHISTLGRSLKALEAAKKKVSELKGIPKADKINVPANLKSIFPVRYMLGPDEIIRYHNTLEKARDQIFNKFSILNKLAENSGPILEKFEESFAKLFDNEKTFIIQFGDEKNPMPGGTYQKWTFKLNEEDDFEGLKIYNLEIEEDSEKYTDGSDNAYLEIANKEKLKSIIDKSIEFCKKLIQDRDSAERRASQIDRVINKIDNEISVLGRKKEQQAQKNEGSGRESFIRRAGDKIVSALKRKGKNNKTESQKEESDKEQSSDNENIGVSEYTQEQKKHKNNLKAVKIILTKGPMIQGKFMPYAYSYFKGVLKYTNLCIKNTRNV